VGCDLFVDVHGDEEIPLNFVSGMEGVPGWGPRLMGLQGLFTASYGRADPSMQASVSYDPDPPMGANMSLASNQVAHRFDCLSVTLEQPFKDCASVPDPSYGWTDAKCANLGKSLLDAVKACAPHLRAKGPFWETLHPQDAYVRPVGGSSEMFLAPSRGGGGGGDKLL